MYLCVVVGYILEGKFPWSPYVYMATPSNRSEKK